MDNNKSQPDLLKESPQVFFSITNMRINPLLCIRGGDDNGLDSRLLYPLDLHTFTFTMSDNK